MSLVFMIPGPLRELAGGCAEVRVERVEDTAGSVSEALSLLWAACPAVRDRVLTELGEVRPHVNVFVDGQNIRDAGGLAAPVRDGSEIYILPAVSGG
ncbi:MAG: ubiquitin-like small modifier protein 1 [Acidobacteriota bacterium]